MYKFKMFKRWKCPSVGEMSYSIDLSWIGPNILWRKVNICVNSFNQQSLKTISPQLKSVLDKPYIILNIWRRERTESYQIKYVLSWKILSSSYFKLFFNELLYLSHKNKEKTLFITWLVKSASKYSGLFQSSLKSKNPLPFSPSKLSCLLCSFLFYFLQFRFKFFFQLFLRRGWHIMSATETMLPSRWHFWRHINDKMH